MDTLVDQAGLPYTGLAHQGHHLAVARARLGQRLLQGGEFRLTPDKAGEAPRRRGLEAAVQRAGPDQLEDLHRRVESLDRHRPEGGDPHQPLDQPRVAAVSRMVPGVASCSMRAAKCVVWPTAE